MNDQDTGDDMKNIPTIASPSEMHELRDIATLLAPIYEAMNWRWLMKLPTQNLVVPDEHAILAQLLHLLHEADLLALRDPDGYAHTSTGGLFVEVQRYTDMELRLVVAGWAKSLETSR